MNNTCGRPRQGKTEQEGTGWPHLPKQQTHKNRRKKILRDHGSHDTGLQAVNESDPPRGSTERGGRCDRPASCLQSLQATARGGGGRWSPEDALSAGTELRVGGSERSRDGALARAAAGWGARGAEATGRVTSGHEEAGRGREGFSASTVVLGSRVRVRCSQVHSLGFSI